MERPARLFAVFAVCAGLAAATEHRPQQTDSDTLSRAEVASKVSIEAQASLEEDIEIVIPRGEAVRVSFTKNVYDLETLVLHAAQGGRIWFDDGSRFSAKNFERLDGALEQLCGAPIAALVSWTATEDALSVRLRVTSDAEAISRTLKEVQEDEKNWSLRLQDQSLLALEVLSENERIIGFVRLWSEVKANFAFFDQVPDLDWDAVLDETLPRVRAAATTPEYYDVLRECMALLQDGHTEIWGPTAEPTGTLPVLLAEIEGRAVVVGLRAVDSVRSDTKRGELTKSGLVLGEEVTSVDGVPVSEILEQRIYPRLCASTPQQRATKAYPKLLRGDAGTVAELSVRALNGEERKVRLTRGYLSASRQRPKRPDARLADGMIYVPIASFGHRATVERFEAQLESIRGARGLLLDLRGNGGGHTKHANAILGYLTNERLKGSKWKTRLYRPAFRAWGRPEEWHTGEHSDVLPAKDPFLGPIVVLTDTRTISAAEDFLVVLKAAGRATLVGERTAGSTGQPLKVPGLPGGGGARICTKRDTFPDGTEFVGIGVIPDVEISPSARDIVEQRDVVFERGVEELKRLIER